MIRRFFYDNEFIEDGKTIDLLSTAMVAEDGTEYYAIVDDVVTITRAVMHPWLRENVVPFLPVTILQPNGGDAYQGARRWSWNHDHPDIGAVRSRERIASDLLSLLVPDGWPVALGPACELWAYYSAFDHVSLAQLWGSMVTLPPGMPMLTRELVQRWEDCGRPAKPVQAPDSQHDARADARWNRALWMVCEEVRQSGACRVGSGGLVMGQAEG